MGLFEDISARHERLKHRIHNFRMPLSFKGRMAMNVVYFFTPIISGYYLMQWIGGRAEANLKDAGVIPRSYRMDVPGQELPKVPFEDQLEEHNEKALREVK